MLRWLKAILRKHIIRDVSDELAACEFGCSALECSHGKWEQCERRILYSKQLKTHPLQD